MKKKLNRSRIKAGMAFLVILSVLVCGVSVDYSFAEAKPNLRIKRLISDLYEPKKYMNSLRRLPGYGEEVIVYVLPLLQDKENNQVRAAALKVLADVGDSSIEGEVIVMLNDSSPRVRRAVGNALAVIGTKKSVEPLKKLVHDYDPGVRYKALMALARILPGENTDIFIGALNDIDPRVRLYAVKGLAKKGEVKAVPYLAHLSQDMDMSVRMQLAKTLGVIGVQETLEPLSYLVNDPEFDVRNIAIESVANVNSPQVNAILVEITNNLDPRISAKGIDLLIPRDPAAALKIAKDKMDDEHMKVRLMCIYTIGKLGSKSDLVILKPLLKAESTKVRKQSQLAINNINKK